MDCGSVASSVIGPGSNQYSVNLTGANVCDGKYVNINLQDVVANDGTVSTTVVGPPIGLLLGDVNGNRAVTNADVSLVKAQVANGGTVNASNFRMDVNANGGITNGDISIVKAQVAAGAQLTASP